jgi:hypothetical protein
MPSYRKDPKTPTHLAYEDARDEARQKVRVFTRRVTDLAYIEIDQMFIEVEKAGGEVLSAEDVDVKAAIARSLEPARKALGVPREADD